MKERLFDLIDGFRELDAPQDGRSWTEHLTDHLLANGVIVPPVKVGQTVYVNGFGVAEPHSVVSVQSNMGMSGFVRWRIEAWIKGEFPVSRDSGVDFWWEDEFGKNVFSTEEEAKQALAETKKRQVNDDDFHS